MRLTITRGGGLGGIVTETVLDGATLSDDDRRTLAARVQAVAPGASASDEAQPDETLYRLLVEDGERVEAAYTDGTLPEPVRTLVAWVDEHPARQARIVG